MGKRKVEEDPAPSAPLWMCSYADLMGLLLCFFIILFAYSTPNELKFGMAASSLRDAFGIFSSQKSKPFTPPVVDPKLLEGGNEKEKLVKLAEYLRNYLKKNDYSNYVNIIPHKNTIKLRIKGTFLFDDESDVVTNNARPLLNEILNCGVHLKNSEIRIEAHTNDVPLTKGKFKS
ncbi:hypothetical protein HY745_12865, partial [Candidatus Desantisbacteria bacterium]|nr:hypothetical protein [Candidatus Desantisbacteria bacterium]